MTTLTVTDPRSVRCSFSVRRCPESETPVRVLCVAGEIDLSTCSSLGSALAAVLSDVARRPATHLVVDLAGVTFCSARGHGMLHAGAESARRAGIGYTLAGLSPHLRRIVALWADENVIRQREAAEAVGVG